MKICDLRELLTTLDDDAEVIMSKDAEGNAFSPLSSHSGEYRYNADSPWSGEITSNEDCDEDWALYGEEGPCDHSDCRWSEGVKAVVLWPVN